MRGVSSPFRQLQARFRGCYWPRLSSCRRGPLRHPWLRAPLAHPWPGQAPSISNPHQWPDALRQRGDRKAVPPGQRVPKAKRKRLRTSRHEVAGSSGRCRLMRGRNSLPPRAPPSSGASSRGLRRGLPRPPPAPRAVPTPSPCRHPPRPRSPPRQGSQRRRPSPPRHRRHAPCPRQVYPDAKRRGPEAYRGRCRHLNPWLRSPGPHRRLMQEEAPSRHALHDRTTAHAAHLGCDPRPAFRARFSRQLRTLSLEPGPPGSPR